MNKSLSYVYSHRDEYQEVFNLLSKNSKTLPGLEDAYRAAHYMLDRCNFFEKWGIDIPYFDDGLDYESYTLEVKTRQIDPPEEMLVICHSTGPFIFSCSGLDNEDYPQEFFQSFYDEVKRACSPDYTDELNHKLYYRRSRAAEAYKSYVSIRKKYMELNKERVKKWRIERLERELEKAKGELK